MAVQKETQDQLFGLFDAFMRKGSKQPEDIMQLMQDTARVALGGTAAEIDKERTRIGQEIASDPTQSDYALIKHHAAGLAVRALAQPVDGLLERYHAEYPAVSEKPALRVVPDLPAEVA